MSFKIAGVLWGLFSKGRRFQKMCSPEKECGAEEREVGQGSEGPGSGLDF